MESDWNRGPNEAGLVGWTNGLCARVVADPGGDTTVAGCWITNGQRSGGLFIDLYVGPDLTGDETYLYFVSGFFAAVNFPYGWQVDPPAPQPA